MACTDGKVEDELEIRVSLSLDSGPTEFKQNHEISRLLHLCCKGTRDVFRRRCIASVSCAWSVVPAGTVRLRVYSPGWRLVLLTGHLI